MRDMDVVRKMVLALSTAEVPLGEVEGVSASDFILHACLLMEAELAIGTKTSSSSRPGFPNAVVLHRLTWAGYDFADQIRDDTLWQKAKEHVIQPAGSFAFGILGEFLKAEIRKRIPGLG
ncbi:DUF2513 domain-containing protein [Niveibacterium sp. SC-1]|uniref:DUF2513 domain-containing protein n=1 Tax=Niveibacterium sp. SC-1 TaxID=3135646 RepID=UPI00311ECC5A